MQVVFAGNVQMQTGNKNRKEWFLISKSDSLNRPLQHIQHYRKHMMPGLQGMCLPFGKLRRLKRHASFIGKQRNVSPYFMKEGKDASPTHLSWVFLWFWLVCWFGKECVCFLGFFPKDHAEFPSSYSHLPTQENSDVHPAVLLSFNTNIFEKTESISITLSMAF